MKFTLNGVPFTFDGDPSTPLLWVIRDNAQLLGTKYGCGIGACGACTVHFNGNALRSCVMPISAVEGGEVRTIESLAQTKLAAVQEAWEEIDVPQCGYCQTGMIMTASALLTQTPNPTDEQIDKEILNICRCGTYQRIREAVHVAAQKLSS